MKLTKIESYEIQAFAFRVMTAYTAPGKDVSPMANDAPYEERCAAFDEWRNEYAPCILAMLHGFEALIDRDGEPTRALLDRLKAAEEENERLREACLAMIEWDDREQDHAVDFGARMALCKRAFDLARAALEDTDAR